MAGVLAVSLGDPAGVGPELVCEAWARRNDERLTPFFVTGAAAILATAAKARGVTVPIVTIADPSEARSVFDAALPVLGDEDGVYTPGEANRDGAALALASLTHAVALTISGKADGVVTAPIAKDRLAEVGFRHPGQTEFVAQACKVSTRNAVMMLAGPKLRTVPITVHCALAEVPQLLSIDLIRTRCAIVARALVKDFGIRHPRLAVCALNPHAGEQGRFGDEEQRIIAPAISALANEGIAITGPHSADGLFAPHLRGEYDVAICMYHDQALIPLKALDFDNGVNVTLGLPIVRTSPDHGTAFGIAGRRIANPGATIAAIRMASNIAARRQDA